MLFYDLFNFKNSTTWRRSAGFIDLQRKKSHCHLLRASSGSQLRSHFSTCIIHGCLINNSASGGHPCVAWWALIKTLRAVTVGVWCLLIARFAGAADSRLTMCRLPLRLRWSPAAFCNSWAHFQLSLGASDEPHFTLFGSTFFPAGDWITLQSHFFLFVFYCTSFSLIHAPSPPSMIGVNSLHSAGRLRSRSLCTVRYGRDFRMMDPFRYPRTPRSRSLKPLVFPDLLGKAQDGQNHPQARKRRKVLNYSLFPLTHHLSTHQSRRVMSQLTGEWNMS